MKQAKYPNLYKREGIYIFRKQVPEPLRGELGRCEIRCSLPTKKRRHAILRANALALRLEGALAVWEMAKTLDEKACEKIVRDHFWSSGADYWAACAKAWHEQSDDLPEMRAGADEAYLNLLDHLKQPPGNLNTELAQFIFSVPLHSGNREQPQN